MGSLVVGALAAASALSACTRTAPRGSPEAGVVAAPPPPPPPTLERAELGPSASDAPAATPRAARDSLDARRHREALVRRIEASGYVKSARVLAALRQVPRHMFIPEVPLADAYADMPLPIGSGQTISQPTVVGEMTDALELRGRERVLEIGTGSGYQAAVLSVLAAEVYSIEIVPELGERAARRLRALGYANVHVRVGDGYAGWPEHAPFDRIIVTAAPPEIPRALTDQLAEGGVLVAPVGEQYETQWLVRVRKKGDVLRRERLEPVRFVPMVPGR